MNKLKHVELKELDIMQELKTQEMKNVVGGSGGSRPEASGEDSSLLKAESQVHVPWQK